MLFCALTASIALSPVVRIDSQPKMLKMTSSRSGRRQMSSLASVVSSSYPFRDSFSKRSLVRRALTPREFGPVRGFEEPFADKIEVMMSMFYQGPTRQGLVPVMGLRVPALRGRHELGLPHARHRRNPALLRELQQVIMISQKSHLM